MSQDTETFTYRGRSLEELVPRIRQELGDDAVIVGRRETTSGGVGGFFAKREIEVEVRPGESWAGAGQARAFAQQLAQAQERQGEEPQRVVSPEIDALPSSADVTVDDLFPSPSPQGGGLAALFNAGVTPTGPVAPSLEEAEALAADEPAAIAAPSPAPVPDPAPASAVIEPEIVWAPEAEAEPEPVAPAPEVVRAEDPIAHVEQPTGAFDYLTPAAAEEPAPAAGGRAVPEAARAAAERLVARGLDPALAETVAEEAIASLAPLLPDADPRDLVADALARHIPVAPLRRAPGVIGFVGPGGAGKTRCVARLAAAHMRHGAVDVTVVSLRSPDAGAELTRLLAPYGVTLHAVESGAEGAALIAQQRGQALVIVDTPGVSPRAAGELRALATELEALAPDELHLAVPATIAPAAARELVRGVRELGVGALALTHTDETEQIGTVVGLAIDCGLPLSFLARGQAVDAGLRPVSAGELAAELVP